MNPQIQKILSVLDPDHKVPIPHALMPWILSTKVIQKIQAINTFKKILNIAQGIGEVLGLILIVLWGRSLDMGLGALIVHVVAFHIVYKLTVFLLQVFHLTVLEKRLYKSLCHQSIAFNETFPVAKDVPIRALALIQELHEEIKVLLSHTLYKGTGTSPTLMVSNPGAMYQFALKKAYQNVLQVLKKSNSETLEQDAYHQLQSYAFFLEAYMYYHRHLGELSLIDRALVIKEVIKENQNAITSHEEVLQLKEILKNSPSPSAPLTQDKVLRI